MHGMEAEAVKSPGRRVQAPCYFIPVCLYPHTRYRTRTGLGALIEKFALDRNGHMIVVADFLLALDNLVTGRFWNPDMVFDKARRQGAEIFNLIRKTARQHDSDKAMSLKYWDEVAATKDFKDFLPRITAACKACEPFRTVVEEFVQTRIDRFAGGDAGNRQYQAETDYILGEISMSVYCTEVLGYSTEIWEKPMEPGAPDPLGVLYTRHPDLVRQVCGKDRLDRRLEFLYPG